MANRAKASNTEFETNEAPVADMTSEESAFAKLEPKKKTGFSLFPKLLILVLLVSVASSGYLYMQIRTLSKDPAAANQAKIQDAVDRVSKLMVLPEGEVPTLATITDKSKLEGQPFFINAKVGDEVLLYPGAKKAILYDPVANIILDVSSINIGQ